MKKFPKLLLLSGLLIFISAIILVGVGCTSSNASTRPTQLVMSQATYDDTTKLITWNAVDNASGYQLRVGDDIKDSALIVERGNHFEFFFDQPESGTFYVFIKVLGGEVDGHIFTDSEEIKIIVNYTHEWAVNSARWISQLCPDKSLMLRQQRLDASSSNLSVDQVFIRYYWGTFNDAIVLTTSMDSVFHVTGIPLVFGSGEHFFFQNSRLVMVWYDGNFLEKAILGIETLSVAYWTGILEVSDLLMIRDRYTSI